MAFLPKKPLRPRPPLAPAVSTSYLESFIAYAAGECHLADNTVAAYRRDTRRFFQWLEARSVPALTIRDLADYVHWLHQQKLNPTSIARHIASLRVFFRYLQLEGVLVESQAELLGSQKLWERVPKVLSPAQVNRLFETPRPGERCWRRDRALLELLYATGCRASELSNLMLHDLHLDEGYCTCRGKGDKQRMVPLGAKAAAAVRAFFEHERGRLAAPVAPPPQWVLLSYRGRRLRRERIWELMKRYALRAGAARDQSPHHAAQLRHAHAGRRGRPAAGARDAGPRQHRHDPDLYARRSHAAEGRTPQVPSPGVNRKRGINHEKHEAHEKRKRWRSPIKT